MRRISVVGNSGSGKSTLAAALAAELGVPHLELDAVFNQAGWQPLPRDEFRARVAAFTAGDGWVADGNYSPVRDLVWARADTVAWLDPPRWRVMRQLTRRTLTRMARRTELWNGNRESWASLFRIDPAESILRQAWTRHALLRERYGSARADPDWARLEFVRLATTADIQAFLARARAQAAADDTAASDALAGDAAAGSVSAAGAAEDARPAPARDAAAGAAGAGAAGAAEIAGVARDAGVTGDSGSRGRCDPGADEAVGNGPADGAGGPVASGMDGERVPNVEGAGDAGS